MQWKSNITLFLLLTVWQTSTNNMLYNIYITAQISHRHIFYLPVMDSPNFAKQFCCILRTVTKHDKWEGRIQIHDPFGDNQTLWIDSLAIFHLQVMKCRISYSGSIRSRFVSLFIGRSFPLRFGGDENDDDGEKKHRIPVEIQHVRCFGEKREETRPSRETMRPLAVNECFSQMNVFYECNFLWMNVIYE